MKIYISPEVRTYNTYAHGGTNEHKEMQDLAGLIEDHYKQYGGAARVAKPSLTVTTKTNTANGRPVSGRIADAVEWGADLYIGLHSNARGPATTGPAKGPIVFYNKGDKAGNEYSLRVYEALTAIMPHHSPNGAVRPHTTFYEVTEPGHHGMAAVYIEVEFHDQEDTARWIVENKDAIAYTIARAIAEGAGLLKEGEGQSGGGTTAPTEPKTYPFDIPYIARQYIQGYSAPRWPSGRENLRAIKRPGDLIESTERLDLNDSAFVKDKGTGGWYLVKADGRWQVSDARPKRYTVKTGDTLWSIAQSQLGDPHRHTDIAALNGIINPNSISTGQTLDIPKR